MATADFPGRVASSSHARALSSVRPQLRDPLRPGLALAFAFAWGLAMARLIDVSDDGPAMLLFGTTFSATLFFACLARPRWFLLLMLAYLPFSKVYPLPLAGITGANLTNLVLLMGIVAAVRLRLSHPRRSRFGRAEVLTGIFVLVSSLSLYHTYVSGGSLGEVAQIYRAWLTPMAFFFLARSLVRDREDIRAILMVLAWTAFLVGADTWKEGLDRSSRGSIDAARVDGLMEQPNSMGAFLAYYGAPLLTFALSARPIRRGWPYLLGFLVAARATLYTFSRGAYLAYAAGTTSALLFVQPLLLVVASGGGLLAVGLFPSLLPDSIRQRLGETTSEQALYHEDGSATSLDKSSSHRLVLWKGAVRMIADHPVTGVGIGRFQWVIGAYTDVPLKKTDPHDAHNAYLLQAAEMGLPSLFLMLCVLATFGFTALRLRLRHPHPLDRALGAMYLSSLAAVLVSCLLGSRFSDEALIGGFWVVSALVVVVGKTGRPRARRLLRG